MWQIQWSTIPQSGSRYFINSTVRFLWKKNAPLVAKVTRLGASHISRKSIQIHLQFLLLGGQQDPVGNPPVSSAANQHLDVSKSELLELVAWTMDGAKNPGKKNEDEPPTSTGDRRISTINSTSPRKFVTILGHPWHARQAFKDLLQW